MNELEKAARQALEALNNPLVGPMPIQTRNAITALRQALEKPAPKIDYRAECWPESPHYKPKPEQPAQQEPVANNWSVFNSCVEVWGDLSFDDAVVELTPERLERGWSAVCVINKENPPLYTRPQAREPVKVWDAEGYDALCQELEMWKAKAQAREPLSLEEIDDMARDAFACRFSGLPVPISRIVTLVRATEAAHGIKGD